MRGKGYSHQDIRGNGSHRGHVAEIGYGGLVAKVKKRRGIFREMNVFNEEVGGYDEVG